MSLDQWITFVGTVAVLCTTVAFVPQILRVRRQGRRTGRAASPGKAVRAAACASRSTWTR